MQLRKIDDPRSPIEKLSRKELEYLGRKEDRNFPDGMPAEIMKARFRIEPPSENPIPMRNQLGNSARLVIPPYHVWLKVAFGQPAPPPSQEIKEVDAVSDLEAQWLQQAAPQEVVSEKKLPRIVTLRRECKSLGIAFKSTDKADHLESLINGQNAT